MTNVALRGLHDTRTPMSDFELQIVADYADAGIDPVWQEWSRYARIAALAEIERRWDHIEELILETPVQSVKQRAWNYKHLPQCRRIEGRVEL